MVASISDSLSDSLPLGHVLNYFPDAPSYLTSRKGLAKDAIRGSWSPFGDFSLSNASVPPEEPKDTHDCGVIAEDLNAHWLHTLQVLCSSPELRTRPSRIPSAGFGGKAHASIISAALKRAALFAAAHKSKSTHSFLSKESERVGERQPQAPSTTLTWGQALDHLPPSCMVRFQEMSASNGGRRGRKRSSSYATNPTSLTKADLFEIVRDERKRSLLNGEEIDRWSSDNDDADDLGGKLYVSGKRLAQSSCLCSPEGRSEPPSCPRNAA